ncbi:MAG: DoxX family membrane protein [Chloroflexi bacterium]|nr:DoxX family membrane protein [Chloroflexota bacterium]
MRNLKAISEPRAPLWPIALSRMAIGLLWLFSLRWKLPPDFAPDQGRGLMDWLMLEVEHAAFGFYGNFVESVVIPNFTFFAWLIFLAELVVGLLLLTGTLTRLAGLLGLLMSINLGLGLLEVPGEWPWSYAMMAMWHGLFIVTAAGRLWGIDAWLRRKGGLTNER